LGVGLAGLVLVAALVLATGPGGVAVASRPGAPARITVGQGETVWDLAERYAPDGIDRRAYVDAILELNGLDGMPLAGQRLKLPK
ncbi:MAG: LysM peptidoglycan-binding domain-containing protein, partial [Actinomycetota bacterium]|nr:LysM peptidoglycan-binding domain-containing protein [Actinomycetota bacterium]